MTKGITMKISRLCVCVLINKRSSESLMCLDHPQRIQFNVALRPQRPYRLQGRWAQNGHLHFHTQLLNSDNTRVQCCLTSTETPPTIGTGNPERPPSLSHTASELWLHSSSMLLNSHRDLRTTGMGSPGRPPPPLSHTAPELCTQRNTLLGLNLNGSHYWLLILMLLLLRKR